MSSYWCYFEDGNTAGANLPSNVDVFKLIDEYNATFEVGIIKVVYDEYSPEDHELKYYHVPVKRVPCTNKRKVFKGVNNYFKGSIYMFGREGNYVDWFNGENVGSGAHAGLELFYNACRDGQTDWVQPEKPKTKTVAKPVADEGYVVYGGNYHDTTDVRNYVIEHKDEYKGYIVRSNNGWDSDTKYTWYEAANGKINFRKEKM